MIVEQPVLYGNLKRKIDSKASNASLFNFQPTIIMITLWEVRPDFNQKLRDEVYGILYKECYEYKISSIEEMEDLAAILQDILPKARPNMQVIYDRDEEAIFIMWFHRWIQTTFLITAISQDTLPILSEELIDQLCRSIMRLEYAETFIYYTQPHG